MVKLTIAENNNAYCLPLNLKKRVLKTLPWDLWNPKSGRIKNESKCIAAELTVSFCIK